MRFVLVEVQSETRVIGYKPREPRGRLNDAPLMASQHTRCLGQQVLLARKPESPSDYDLRFDGTERFGVSRFVYSDREEIVKGIGFILRSWCLGWGTGVSRARTVSRSVSSMSAGIPVSHCSMSSRYVVGVRTSWAARKRASRSQSSEARGRSLTTFSRVSCAGVS